MQSIDYYILVAAIGMYPIVAVYLIWCFWGWWRSWRANTAKRP